MSTGRGNDRREKRGWYASSTLRTLYILLVVILVAGCGPQKVARQDVSQEAAKGSGGAVTIESIGVVGEGNSILIEGSDKIKYTAFRLADPPRLLIDMPGISLDKVSKPIFVNNDYITEVTTSTYGEGEQKIGRIEVGLHEGVEHDIKVGDQSLMVALRKNVFISGFTEPTDMDEEGVEEEVVIDEVPVASTIDDDEPSPVAGRGDTIVGVETSGGQGESVVSIVENGPPNSYNAFGLDSPARLVIDIWGVKNDLPQRSIVVRDEFVERVRIGDHPDKSRVVIDLSGDEVPPHTIAKVENTLRVTFGEADSAMETGRTEVAVAEREEEFESFESAAIAQLVEETEGTREMGAPLEQAAPVAPERLVKVYGVDFSSQDTKARLTVTTSDRARYKVVKSSDATVVALDLDGTTISTDLSRVLDASGLRTSVSSISSFQASGAPDNVVRVLVKLREPSLYTLSQEGAAIHIDFPLTDGGVAQRNESGMMRKSVDVEGEVSQYSGRKISLDLTDADIRHIIRLIAEVSNLNIIAGDNVRGKVSLRLIDVPWDQAFDIILMSKGLGKIEQGNVVMIAPQGEIKREEEVRLASKKAQEKLEDLSIKLIPVNYAKASDLEKHLSSVLSDRGSVSTEGRTNTLIVRDIKAILDESVALVSKLDLPTPQVLIETRIVEAQSSFARDLGIQWGVDYATSGNTHTDVFGSSDSFGQNSFDPGIQGILKDGGGVYPTEKVNWPGTAGVSNYAVNLPAAGTAGPLGGLGFILGKLGTSPLILDLRLTAGEQAGLTKTISRPRITTLDNKEAKIEQGESIPFETTSASGTATEFVDANLSLTVTPHITPDGSVLMKIKASRNSIGSFRTSSGLPSINKKEASTEVLVKDGETTVIGGIVVSDKSDSDKGIPFLKNVPILGWLFKSKSVSDSQTELLIFITPTILKNS